MNELFDLPVPPSRAARKRELEEKRHLAVRLLELSERHLVRLELPEELMREIALAKKIGRNGAIARQMRVLQKMIDELDDQELGAKITNVHHKPVPTV